MTGEDLRAARGTLGAMWGLGRPLRMAELGRVLRLGGRDPGESIRDYERGTTRISGPMALAVDLMLAGAKPPGLAEGSPAIDTTFEMRLAGAAALEALREAEAASSMELAEAAYVAMEQVRRA